MAPIVANACMCLSHSVFREVLVSDTFGSVRGVCLETGAAETTCWTNVRVVRRRPSQGRCGPSLRIHALPKTNICMRAGLPRHAFAGCPTPREEWACTQARHPPLQTARAAGTQLSRERRDVGVAMAFSGRPRGDVEAEAAADAAPSAPVAGDTSWPDGGGGPAVWVAEEAEDDFAETVFAGVWRKQTSGVWGRWVTRRSSGLPGGGCTSRGILAQAASPRAAEGLARPKFRV